MVLRLEQEDPGFDSSFLPGNKVTGEQLLLHENLPFQNCSVPADSEKGMQWIIIIYLTSSAVYSTLNKERKSLLSLAYLKMSHVRSREKCLLALRELSLFVDPLRSAGYLASVWHTRSAAARRWRESRSSTTSPLKTSGAITPSGRTTTSGPVRNSGSRWPPLRRQALKRRRWRWRRQRRLPTLTCQHWPKMKQKSPSRHRQVPGKAAAHARWSADWICFEGKFLAPQLSDEFYFVA